MRCFIPNVSSKTEDLTFIVDELRNYITHNQLKSAVLKIGLPDMNNNVRMAAIKKEFSENALADFNENNDYLLKTLTMEEQD